MISEEQKELADFIKKVHVSLRKESKIIGSDAAWRNHIKQEALLNDYAKSMKKLATKYWDSNSKNNSQVVDRVKWIVEQCEEYFKNDGLFKEREKELKKEQFYANNGKLQANDKKSFISVNKEKLDVLDVGSCYNPFKNYSFLNVLPLDLMPASSDVYQCDFLSLEIINNKEKVINEDSFSKNIIKSLFRNSFDIIVFSLLLEYLPSPTQRYTCCLKAYELLKNEGLLFIITPDSKNPTANSFLMKNWKIALAHIGYTRIYYKKFPHIHCMAYRKNLNCDIMKQWSLKICGNNDPTQMITIPQDLQNYIDINNVSNEDEERNEEENQKLADSFNELPF